MLTSSYYDYSTKDKYPELLKESEKMARHSSISGQELRSNHRQNRFKNQATSFRVFFISVEIN